jgi:uncharacterized CHY-type Zn-finger protein
MSMTRRAITGHIENYTNEGDDKAIVCQACQHIIVSQSNLGKDDTCPYCHNNVNSTVGNDNLMVEAEYDDIAESI